MVSNLGLTGGPWFIPLSAIYSPFVSLKVHEGLCLGHLTLHMRVWVARERGCYRYDIHIKPKSYKVKVLRELIV